MTIQTCASTTHSVSKAKQQINIPFRALSGGYFLFSLGGPRLVPSYCTDKTPQLPSSSSLQCNTVIEWIGCHSILHQFCCPYSRLSQLELPPRHMIHHLHLKSALHLPGILWLQHLLVPATAPGRTRPRRYLVNRSRHAHLIGTPSAHTILTSFPRPLGLPSSNYSQTIARLSSRPSGVTSGC